MTQSCNKNLTELVLGLSKNILVEKPCKIVKIHSPYLVDVEIYENNVPDYLYNVPVKHLQTNSAFIYLGLKIGARGTVRFFDTDISQYYQNSDTEGKATRLHDINDNYFTTGFYPENEQYILPEGDICIGTGSGALIKINGNSISITGENILINAANLTLSGNTTIDDKVFLNHTHSNGNNGGATGGVI